MKPIEMKLAARRDLREAVRWYLKKDRELPERFLTAFSHAVDRIENILTVGSRWPAGPEASG
jgi:hypothetical protein